MGIQTLTSTDDEPEVTQDDQHQREERRPDDGDDGVYRWHLARLVRPLACSVPRYILGVYGGRSGRPGGFELRRDVPAQSVTRRDAE